MSSPEELERTIDAALARFGPVESMGDEYFLDARFNEVPWAPMFCRRAGGKIWAIEVLQGDLVPEFTIHAMSQLVSVEPGVQPAFLVPEGEPDHKLIERCRDRKIAVIFRAGAEAEAFTFAGAAAVVPPACLARIPPWVIERIPDLADLDSAFRSALTEFARKHRCLWESGTMGDEQEERLLAETFLALLKTNADFTATYDPIELLRFFERSDFEGRGRDHYFHSFNNFLLGSVIIDGCYDTFRSFVDCYCPRARTLSIEYVWLLTVLFHDVGYPIQRRAQTSQMLYGVPAITEEMAIAERKQAWETPPYRTSRAQLVSLYQHLTQPAVASDWSPDPFPVPEAHPLDIAFADSFLHGEHGVASSMRMLADFFRSVPSSVSHRQFLAQHIFLAGLSIPFHDYSVRSSLRKAGIERISSARFPFAALLMFVDTIQEDRREEIQQPDVLTGVTASGNAVAAEMNLRLWPSDKVKDKRIEVRDVKSFLREDSLVFGFPSELL
jgi:hypothetical protein